MSGALLLATAGKAVENLSIFEPVSPPAESIRNLSLLMFAITGFIFVVVEGVLFYSIFRFRKRAGDVTTEPAQVYGSVPIEIAWTAAPVVVVFIIVLVVTRSLWEVKVSPPAPRPNDNALYITVTGRQWWWEYTYDKYNGKELGFTTANELHIPASEEGIPRPVYLTLKSADVCHSFWVPRLAGKTDLIPGHPNEMWFQTSEKGVYLGQCAEYCGTQHANMFLRVVVDAPADFEKWLNHEQQPAVEDPNVSAGKTLFLSQSCVNCHPVRGTTAKGTYAPDLTHLMSRETLAAGAITNTPENLRKWIKDPQGEKPGCLMPAFGLKESDNELIVRYLLTLQ